jgi:hybrid cluster-associated redox disulfide protein
MTKVTKNMTLGEVVEKYPASAVIMMKYGLHCVGCHAASWETIEQGAKAHGMSSKEIDKMLKEINKEISKK